jgi:hypothetical protein
VDSSKDKGMPIALAIEKVFFAANIPEATPLDVTNYIRYYHYFREYLSYIL